MKKEKKNLLRAILVIFLGALSLIFLLNLVKLRTTSAKFLLPLYLPRPTPNPWLTYTNQKYKYSLLYNSDFKLNEWDFEEAVGIKSAPDGSIVQQIKFNSTKGDDGFEVLVWENQNRVEVKDWVTWFRHEDLDLKTILQEENVYVAGLPALRFIQKETARGKPILYIFFAKDEKIYELLEEREDLKGRNDGAVNFMSQPVFDRMVESFKFLP